MPVTNKPPKSLQSAMETQILTIDQVNKWRLPPFQRPLRVNQKVLNIANEMRCDGVSISGTLTLGRLKGDPGVYLVDGQHRVEAFRQSGMEEIIADTRTVNFDTMAEMADEFVSLNTAIVRMRPDDLLRGLTPTLPNLARIMRECTFIGYDQVRRGKTDSGAVVSIGVVLRCWFNGQMETPNSGNGGFSIAHVASTLDEVNTGQLIRFMKICVEAWGRDPEYYRLWGALNMALCAWLYRRLVLETDRRGATRVIVLNETQFRKCMMTLSANTTYMEWLVGRLLNDRDRGPAFTRIKQMFVRRLQEEGIPKPLMPQPAWSSR